jgi:hypothetical protein
VAKACDGAPDADCACLKVDPDGDDALAEASFGLTHFRNVQPALDFASSHPTVATKVCVAATEDCTAEDELEYPGPSGEDLRMHDGISLYGGYESVGWTRCEFRRPKLVLTTAAGVYFGPDVTSDTVLDGFSLVGHAADTTRGVTVEGARGVTLSGLRISFTLDDPQVTDVPNWYGIDIANDAEVTVTSLYLNKSFFSAGAPVEAIGVRSVGSRVTLSDAYIRIQASAGSAYGVWLEDSPGSSLVGVEARIDTSYDGADTLGGLRVIGSGDIDVTDSSITLGTREESEPTQRAVDITGDGSGTVTLAGVTVKTSGPGTGLYAKGTRVLFDGTLSVSADTDPLGILLEDAPGSQISGAVSATGTSARAIVAKGAGTDLAVVSGTISANGSLGTAVALSLSDCAGGVPMISDSSIAANGVGSVQAILVTGQCHARIESNELIIASGKAPGLGKSAAVDGIRCSGASRCVISDNAGIRTETTVVETSSLLATAVACEAGSCERISDNSISGLGGMKNVCHRSCDTESYGIDLTATDTLVERNRVGAGCADRSTGLRVNSSSSRIQSNEIVGYSNTTGFCQWAPDHSAESFGLVVTASSGPSSVDVHSNTISGGGSTIALEGCNSFAVSGGALYRNNILSGGNCNVRAGLATTGGYYRHNDFIDSHVISGGTDITTELADLNASDGSFGNFQGDPSDAGTTESLPLDDIDGQPRSPTFPDVGAYERGDHLGACTGQTCSGAGMCLVVDSAGECVCHPGYARAAGDPLTCEDIDECATNNGECDPLSACTNTPGGRTCGVCPPGYDGDGESGCIRNP